MLGVVGVMLTEIKLGARTDTLEFPVTFSNVALIVVEPTLRAVTNPAAFVLATLGEDASHFATPLMTCLLLSLNVPVAVNC